MFSTGANYAKLKTNLRLCINRLKLLQKKKTELTLRSRKEIADYISNGKYERAKIRVEHIIREDYMVEGMEIVEMFCDLLLARFGLLQQQKMLDEGLAEPISSILWAAPRLQTDVPEFKIISDQLTIKYGKPYTHSVLMNTVDTINKTLMIKLGVQAPPKILVEKYMIEIAKSNNIPYEPDHYIMQDDVQIAEDILINTDENFKPPKPPNDVGGGGGGFICPPGQCSGLTFRPFDYPPSSCHNIVPPINSADLIGPPPYSFEVPSGHVTKTNPTFPGQLYPTITQQDIIDEKAPLKPPRQQQNNNNHNNPKNGFEFLELPSVPPTAPEESVDFDYLSKRFEELKKRPT